MEKQEKNIKYISESKYHAPFNEFTSTAQDKRKRELALDRAWLNRDFEIDKYWSRATYFWAFIAATFAGYIAIMTSEKMKATFQNELAFIVICMGLVFSVSWWLVNIGSKKWQENWEKHIDMLEDEVTGPLYKTVWNKTAFSVSQINIAVSGFVTGVWLMLAIAQSIGVPYMSDQPLFQGKFDYAIALSATLTGSFLVYLYCSSCRRYKLTSKDKEGYFSFNRRAIHFYGPEDQPEN